MKPEAEHVSRDTWRLPLGLLTGAAFGVLVTLYVVRDPPVVMESKPSNDDATMRAVTESLERLTGRVEELERSLRLLSLAQPAAVGDGDTLEAPAPGRRAVEPADADRDVARTIPANWTETLDKRIATALVERALTPFDPGVAVHVRTAGAAVRYAIDERRAASQSVNERFASGGSSSEQWRADNESTEKRYNAAITEAIRQLESALDALAK